MSRRLNGIFLLLVLTIATAYGQLNRGFISGTVQDASGAVISGATVTITNQSTNVERSATTNDQGFYRFVAVEPGTYTVAISQSGFETRKVANVEVATTQEVTVNQTLSVGTTGNVVDVVETPPGVELSKSSASVERTISQQSIVNLPITGGTRDVTALALLAPTATRGPGSTGISANGQRARNNNFLIDGVDNNDPSVTIVNARTVPEGLQEFQVQTSAYSAEYGHSSGAQISAITRSGSNAYHAEAYDYYQGNWLNPVTLPNKRNNVFHTPRFDQNQAGGDIGGPIKRNKTFFFALLETTRRREAPSAGNASSAVIPTQAGFSLLSTIPLGAATSTLPAETQGARTAALNGLSFLNKIYSLNPGFTNLKTTTVNGIAVPVGTVQIPIANPFDFWFGQARVDHTFSQSDTLSYRYIGDHRTQPDFVSNLSFGSLFSGAQEIFRQNHSLTETHTFSPRLINEFRAAYIRSYLNFPENDPTDPSSTISGFFTVGGLSNYPQGRIGNTFQYQDVATVLAGRHSVKVGVDIRRQRLLNIAAFDSKGTYSFDNFADYLNNRPSQLVKALNTATFDARQWNMYFFAQDDIKVTKDLTVNIGLRYEYNTTPFGFFGATDQNIRNTIVPGPTKDDTNNWAPRFGIAYSPSSKDGFFGSLFGGGNTVFRGGYGVGYDTLFYNILTVNGSNYPRVVVQTLTDRATLANVWPSVITGGSATAFDPTATFVNSPTDLQAPTVHFYSASIQRQFGSNIFEIGYSGSRSYHGIRQGQANPSTLTQAQVNAVLASGSAASAGSAQSRRVNNQYGSRVLIESTAIGNYNAGYVKYDRRFSHGLTFGANYTYSATFSDNDESLGVGAITNSSPQIPQNFNDYRSEYSRSVFDRPHRLALYYNYQVPWFQGGALGSKPARLLMSGWSLNGITDAQSGQPFTIRTGVDTYGNGGAARPDYNPSGIITKDPVTGNLRSFTIPLNGTGIVVTPLNSAGVPLADSQLRYGNLGRNTFRGPGFVNFNFGLIKDTAIFERFRTQLRADFIDLFNHRNFGNPNAAMNSPAFGTNTSDPGGRSITLAMKVIF